MVVITDVCCTPTYGDNPISASAPYAFKGNEKSKITVIDNDITWPSLPPLRLTGSEWKQSLSVH